MSARTKRRWWSVVRAGGLALLAGVGLALPAAGRIVFVPCDDNPAGPNYATCLKAGGVIGWGSDHAEACNAATGYIGTWAHGAVLGSAAAEAVQQIDFYVDPAEAPRTIWFRATIRRMGGAMTSGAGAFAGTYKVWNIDGQRHLREVDRWLTVKKALDVGIELGLAALGAYYPDLSSLVTELGLAYGLQSVFLDFLGAGKMEDLLIEDSFVAEAGWHWITVGLRSQASGTIRPWPPPPSMAVGEAVSVGRVESIVLWGIGEPAPPVVEGPTAGCPYSTYDFTVFNESCLGDEVLANDVLDYRFIWGDGTQSNWHPGIACGLPCTDGHHYTEPGVYGITVQVRDPQDHTTSATTHTIEITTGPPTERPGRISASSGESCNEIHVTWQGVPWATYYRLYRDGTDPADMIYEGPNTYFTDTPPVNLQNPEYSYRVRAYNMCGHTQSRWAGYGHLKLPPDAPCPDATVDDCDVAITWEPVEGYQGFPTGWAEYYKLYRTTVDSAGAVDEPDRIATLYGSHATEYHDSPPAGIDHYYWLRAGNACGESGLSTSACGRRIAGPSPPTNVQASDGAYCGSVRITWSSSDPRDYVLRDGVRLNEYPIGIRQYDDTTAEPDRVYRYEVETCEPQCTVCARSAADTGWRHGPSPAPGTVTASDGAYCDRVQVQWDAVPGASKYEVSRPGTSAQVTGTSWSDTSAVPGTVYTYRVKAYNSVCGWGSATRADTGWRGFALTAAPTGVAATDGLCAVSVTWEPVANATRYSLFRRAAGSQTDELLDDQVVGPPYVDSTGEAYKSYTYWVQAHSTCGSSPASATDTGSAASIPDAPTDVVASQGTECYSVHVTWSPASGATGYRVYRSALPGILGAELVATVTEPECLDTTVLPWLSPYSYYSVRSVNGCGRSSFTISNPAWPLPDGDRDRVCDPTDNCPLHSNYSQADCDGDGIGDVCALAEGLSVDFDGNGVPDECEWAIVYVDCDAPPDGDGSSWDLAYSTLQDALAGLPPGPWEAPPLIRVAAGVYAPDQGGAQAPGDRAAAFSLASGTAICGGFAGFGEPDPNARDVVLYETILSGDLSGNDTGELTDPSRAENSYHVVTATGTAAGTRLSGLTIRGGHADGAAPANQGAGVHVTGGLLEISECTVRHNWAASGGGGLHVSSAASLTATNCTFDGNQATIGGGARVAGSSTLTLVNAVLVANSAVTDGGAVHAVSATPTLVNCSLRGNVAGNLGGGLRSATGVTAALTNCILWGNTDSIGGQSAQLSWLSPPAADYCCVEGWTGDLGGVGNNGDDPLWDAELRLPTGSPGVDSGLDDAVPAGVTDRAGYPREANDPQTPDTGSGHPPMVDRGAYELHTDCNGNGLPDVLDVLHGRSFDRNSNGVPDECEGLIRGDLNCDGRRTFADIDPFVVALMDRPLYESAYPDCHWVNADCNLDGRVDFYDIDEFVALLMGA